jgi:hypothetical protein
MQISAPRRSQFPMPDYDPIEREFLAHASPLPECPPLEILLAAGQGVLPEAVEPGVSQHISTCGVCRVLLQDFATLPERSLTADESARIRAGIPIGRQGFQFRWQWVAAAAAVILVAASVVAYHPWQSSKREIASHVANQVAPTPQQPPVQVALTRLPPDRELITGLVFRGAHSADEPDAAELEPAFAAYMKDHYDAAEKHFSKLAKQYPKADVPVLYLGVSQLFLGQNQAALTTLTLAQELAAPSRRDAAAWYQAIATLRTHSADAGMLFQSLCQRGSSSYSKKACSVFSQMHPESSATPDK